MSNQITSPPTRPGTIVLRGDLKQKIEGVVAASATIYPGMLCEKTTAGGPRGGDYQPHSTQGGFAEKLVAMEPLIADEYQQTYQGGTVDDAYAEGDHVRFHIAQPGESECHMFLKASGSAVVLTDFLQSAGNGDLEKATSTNQRLFKPLEAVTPGSSRTRIRVRAL